MNAIMGFSKLLNYKKDDPNLKYLEIIDKHVQELLRLIEQIIKLSKVLSKETKIIISEFTVQELISEIHIDVLNLRSELNKKHIQLRFNEIHDQDTKINSDREKLRIILINLLGNALKFTETGSVILFFSKESDNNTFIITDTGIGIDEQKLPVIFDSFQKIEENTKLYRGTGIGLALVKNYVNLLNGEIFVESEPGKGTKFTIIIPNLNLINL